MYVCMYINVPPHPVNQATIPVLPPEYQETENGEQFFVVCRWCCRPRKNHHFSSQQTIQVLSNSEHWFADGAFETCPELFFLSIHCSC